jgi:hypothetical protein
VLSKLKKNWRIVFISEATLKLDTGERLQAAIHPRRAAYFSFFTRIPNTHAATAAKATLAEL